MREFRTSVFFESRQKKNANYIYHLYGSRFARLTVSKPNTLSSHLILFYFHWFWVSLKWIFSVKFHFNVTSQWCRCELIELRIGGKRTSSNEKKKWRGNTDKDPQKQGINVYIHTHTYTMERGLKWYIEDKINALYWNAFVSTCKSIRIAGMKSSFLRHPIFCVQIQWFGAKYQQHDDDGNNATQIVHRFECIIYTMCGFRYICWINEIYTHTHTLRFISNSNCVMHYAPDFVRLYGSISVWLQIIAMIFVNWFFSRVCHSDISLVIWYEVASRRRIWFILTARKCSPSMEVQNIYLAIAIMMRYSVHSIRRPF